MPLPSNDIEFSGERKRVRCNEGLGRADPDMPTQRAYTKAIHCSTVAASAAFCDSTSAGPAKRTMARSLPSQ